MCVCERVCTRDGIIVPNRIKTEDGTMKILSAHFELARGREMTAGTSLQCMYSGYCLISTLHMLIHLSSQLSHKLFTFDRWEHDIKKY